MATLILPALYMSWAGATAGTAVTAGVALSAAAWSAVGSYIDNAFIFPALFPPETSYGPKLDDQQMTSAKEGSPKNFCIGPECRTDGQIIWCSKIREIKDTENSSGKGGQSGSFVTYKYYAHVAIGICENQISQVKKIWADGKLIYNVAPDISVTDVETMVGTINQTNPPHIPPVTYYYLTIRSPSGGTDLSKFVSGKQIIMSGFSVADTTNNGAWTCVESGTYPATHAFADDTYVKVRRTSPAFGAFAAFTTNDNPSATLFQEQPAFSLKQVKDITFYYGTEDQEPDPLITAYEGDGNVPGFRGLAYVLFEDLALQDFGNRIPNLVFLIEADVEITLGDAIARILERAEVDSGLYDVSAIQDQNLRGITITGPSAPISDLQPIMIAYNIAAQLRDGVLHFLYREDLPVFAIDPLHLAATFAGEASGMPFKISDKIDYELSSNMSVEFMDPEKDYQTGTELYTPANPMKPNPGTITMPLTLSADEARVIAERLFWLQWVSRQQVNLTLPPSYIYLREGDNITFTYNGSDYQVIIKQIDRGQESQFLVIQGTIEDQSIYDRVVEGETSTEDLSIFFDNERNAGYPAALEWLILDIPALREDHLVKPGFYVAACNAESSIPFGGAILYESSDAGLTYQRADTVYFQANIGVAAEILDATVSEEYFDDVSVLTVVMINGTLSSVTEEQLLKGANRAAIGGEIIGFMNAELVDVNTYELTHLLRGVRGTEAFIATHTTDEYFVHLNGPGVIWHDINASAIETDRLYKLVPNGSFLELEDSAAFTPTAATLRGFAPADFTITKDGSNNDTITFRPRSRALFVDFMPQAVPFLEERDQHDVAIYSHLGVYKRTKTSADGVYSVSYTAAEQTADGLSPGAQLLVTVSRKSSKVFNNATLTKTITPVPL